jgi:hypothetical protein
MRIPGTAEPIDQIAFLLVTEAMFGLRIQGEEVDETSAHD